MIHDDVTEMNAMMARVMLTIMVPFLLSLELTYYIPCFAGS